MTHELDARAWADGRARVIERVEKSLWGRTLERLLAYLIGREAQP